MKKHVNLFLLFAVASFILMAQACSFSTANLSSFKVSNAKDGADTAAFHHGDTIYGKASVSNNPGKVKVKLYLTDDKGATLKGSDVSLDVDGDAPAMYSLPVTEGVPAGSYKLNADMMNDSGEKKDSKSAAITIAE